MKQLFTNLVLDYFSKSLNDHLVKDSQVKNFSF